MIGLWPLAVLGAVAFWPLVFVCFERIVHDKGNYLPLVIIISVLSGFIVYFMI